MLQEIPVVFGDRGVVIKRCEVTLVMVISSPACSVAEPPLALLDRSLSLAFRAWVATRVRGANGPMEPQFTSTYALNPFVSPNTLPGEKPGQIHSHSTFCTTPFALLASTPFFPPDVGARMSLVAYSESSRESSGQAYSMMLIRAVQLEKLALQVCKESRATQKANSVGSWP